MTAVLNEWNLGITCAGEIAYGKHTMIAILDQFSLQERCIKDLPTRFICQQRGQQQQLFFMKLFLSPQ